MLATKKSHLLPALFFASCLGEASTALAQCEPSPIPRAFFGDLHVHTAISHDAFAMGATIRPDGAYRFAKGEAITVEKLNTEVQLAAPLDFAAVTDHAENMGAVSVCADASQPGYRHWLCRLERWQPRLGITLASFLTDETGIAPMCRDAASNNICPAVQAQLWQETLDAAAAHNSPCEFTTLQGWEWSGNASARGSIHRNVIFNQQPEITNPIGSNHYPTPAELFTALEHHCTDTERGCDALTIPHNSNLSSGAMFPALASEAPLSAGEIAQRARFERQVEISQNKGTSECFIGGSDEHCGFELLPHASFLGQLAPWFGKPVVYDTRFVRRALQEGLAYEATAGVNPFKLGIIGSTDTHVGTPGLVAERGWFDHHLSSHRSADGKQLASKRLHNNPGGLAVVYARRNTRADIFDALKRRESYSTSGPRLGLRLFAGDDLPADLCEREDALSAAYAHGQPMGADITEQQHGQFWVSATKAPDLDGLRPGLSRLQIIKGWIDNAGDAREAVYDVTPVISADTPASCNQPAAAAARLCSMWQDPDYRPGQAAVYYARVLEAPSCRWNAHYCEAAAVDCTSSDLGKIDQELCCGELPRYIRERAWSSPIWFQP